MRAAVLLRSEDIERAVDERLNELVQRATVLGPATPIAIKAFTGREWDPETGLYYYRARYYDPGAGRFISEDPIGFFGEDVNLYAYVTNSPNNYGDPTGLIKVKVGGHVITVHQNDVDPFPSDPHGHLYPSKQKVHTGTGEIFDGKNVVGKLSAKQLQGLRGALKKAGLLGLILVAVDVTDAYAADCGQVGSNTTQVVTEAAGGIVGGLAGAKAGAYAGGLIGSLVPGLGTAAGATVGAIIGGISGGVLGGHLAGSWFPQ